MRVRAKFGLVKVLEGATGLWKLSVTGMHTFLCRDLNDLDSYAYNFPVL